MRERRELARTLRRIAEGGAREAAVGGRFRPVHTAARSRGRLLEVLATTLESEGLRVTRTGMLRVRRLITEGTGPLWGTDERALDLAVDETLDALMPEAAVQSANLNAA